MMRDPTAPQTIGFLLVPGFALLSYSATVDPLRAANTLSGRTLYKWRHLTPDGLPALSSNGVVIPPDEELDRGSAGLDMLIICAGGNPADVNDPVLFGHLRRLFRVGVVIGGVSGGPFLMARAGLLAGQRCTIHWEHAAAFEECFPDAVLTRSLFEITESHITCAGAVAALDMMSALIARDHGAALGAAVSDWFLHTQTRRGPDPHRMDLRFRTGVRDERVITVLRAMEANIETPLSRQELASLAGLSVRQLERAFQAGLGHGMHEHYLGVRLARSRQLLLESGLSIAMVAVATGFGSTSDFARSFKKRFGVSPRQIRT